MALDSLIMRDPSAEEVTRVGDFPRGCMEAREGGARCCFSSRS